MNPCRCGRASEPGFACKRGANARCAAEYQGRLSGPLIDRIDLHIEVPAVTAADLILPPPAEGSREVAARVSRARTMQAERYATLGLPQLRTNADAHGPLLEEVARPDANGLALLRDAADAMRLSARRYHRVLRVARTLDSPRRCPIVRSSTRCVARREDETRSQPPHRHVRHHPAHRNHRLTRYSS
jgi:magnesium chelatase family protein